MSSSAAASAGGVPPADWLAMHDLVMGYAEAIDTKDWELFRTFFVADCTMTFGEPLGEIRGLDALADFVAYFHDPLDNSRHATTNFRLSQFDGSSARGRCGVDARLLQSGATGGDTLLVVGVYIDHFVHRAEGWRFAERVFTPIHSEGNAEIGGWDWASRA
jgi:3-phenylpropionate/cinnamic acid dioxygenase small subunit